MPIKILWYDTIIPTLTRIWKAVFKRRPWYLSGEVSYVVFITLTMYAHVQPKDDLGSQFSPSNMLISGSNSSCWAPWQVPWLSSPNCGFWFWFLFYWFDLSFLAWLVNWIKSWLLIGLNLTELSGRRNFDHNSFHFESLVLIWRRLKSLKLHPWDQG